MLFSDFLDEQLKDPKFKVEWDALESEFSALETEIATKAKKRRTMGKVRVELNMLPTAIKS